MPQKNAKLVSTPGATTDGNERPENWLDLHGDYLYQFALRRAPDSHVAEELVQETLLNGLKSYHRFRGDASVRTWLTRILRNEISKYFRRQAKQRSSQSAGGDSQQRGDLTELLNPKTNLEQFRSKVERDEFWQMIQECFERLPPHLFETLMLRLTNECEKIEELCPQIGINESNFAVRLFRSRLMLRKCIEELWGTEPES